MTTILYARVSTAEQTVAHQRTQAEKAGFKFDHVIIDDGVSGVRTMLRDRPEGRRLFDLLRHGDTLVVRWINRLGRNYNDIKDTMAEFMKRGVIVRTVINNMEFDGATTDPIKMAVRDALIGFMAAQAQAEAEVTKEAQRAGIEHSKLNGTKEGEKAYRGRRPSFDRKQFETVRDMLGSGAGVSTISKETGLTRQTIYRIGADLAAAEVILADWGL